MTKEIYTFGYSGKKVEELDLLVRELDAVVFDVRFSPRSRNPRWSGRSVEAALGPGRYRHVRALGNRNYKGGPVDVVDLEAGVAEILASERPVILMCMCPDPERCHRAFIAAHLRSMGLKVQELHESTPIQLRLL